MEEPTMKDKVRALFDQGWAPEDIAGCFLTADEQTQAAEALAEVLAERAAEEAATAAQAAVWDAPLPVVATLPPVPRMAPDMLPAPLREWAADIAAGIPASLEYTGTAALVMASVVIGDRFGIRPKANADWTVVPNLWGLAVGTPSQDKSPATNPIWAALTALQVKADQAHQAAAKDAELAAELWDIDAKKAKEAYKKAATQAERDKAKAELADLEARRPEKPPRRTFYTNDATIEKIAELLQGGGGLGVIRDELDGLFQTLSKAGHETDRAFLLEGWSGLQGQNQHRVGRGHVFAKNIALSIWGTIQPDTLRRRLQAAQNGANDGLLQRFQVSVWPDPLEWSYVDTAPNYAAKKRAGAALAALAELGPEAIGARADEFDRIPTVRFAPDAQAVFREWVTRLETVDVPAAESPLLTEHLKKYRSLMPSLALIFHALDVADGQQPGEGVPKKAADLAVAWCDFLAAHARRIYVGLGDATDKAAATLAAKLTAGKLEDGFTAKDVYDRHWAHLDVAATHDALARLEALGWVRRQPPGKPTGGRPPAPTYEINPLIFD